MRFILEKMAVERVLGSYVGNYSCFKDLCCFQIQLLYHPLVVLPPKQCNFTTGAGRCRMSLSSLQHSALQYSTPTRLLPLVPPSTTYKHAS